MVEIKIFEAQWKDVEIFPTMWFRDMNYAADGFQNSMIFEGKPYSIDIDGMHCGFCAAMDSWDGGRMLSAFYVVHEVRRYSAEILAEVCEKLDISAILVPSCDGHLVSIAFERMKLLGGSFEMQAYNFVCGDLREPKFGMETMVEVQPDEYETMNELTEKQWDGCYGSENFKFYKIVDDGVTLGYGAICRLRANNVNMDIGNFTLPEHRRKGVGSSMLINLSKIVMEMKLTPIAGCWYSNKESIPTLKSSGYIPENRIFYVKFR